MLDLVAICHPCFFVPVNRMDVIMLQNLCFLLKAMLYCPCKQNECDYAAKTLFSFDITAQHYVVNDLHMHFSCYHFKNCVKVAFSPSPFIRFHSGPEGSLLVVNDPCLFHLKRNLKICTCKLIVS